METNIGELQQEVRRSAVIDTGRGTEGVDAAVPLWLLKSELTSRLVWRPGPARTSRAPAAVRPPDGAAHEVQLRWDPSGPPPELSGDPRVAPERSIVRGGPPGLGCAASCHRPGAVRDWIPGRGRGRPLGQGPPLGCRPGGAARDRSALPGAVVLYLDCPRWRRRPGLRSGHRRLSGQLGGDTCLPAEASDWVDVLPRGPRPKSFSTGMSPPAVETPLLCQWRQKKEQSASGVDSLSGRIVQCSDGTLKDTEMVPDS
ncbi:hypothetical protein NDU88_007043 [Pleurodeles waltl]|uniref:Uncharacterized protein n=1 Tax=Pleurodeles waltl TaxID=8319 RepID=A0AAV7PSD9_PLEWA|nr:hypothetical protein NDU88_007043 [Pleurodeles waltl]